MSVPPRILKFNQVPDYCMERWGLKVSLMAAYTWTRYRGVKNPDHGNYRRRNLITLNYTRMGDPPMYITTGAWVDEYLKLTGRVPKESA